MPFPALDLLRGLFALAGFPAAAFGLSGWVATQAPGDAPVPTATVAVGEFSFQQPGEFLLDGLPVANPERVVRFANTIDIMRYLVSAADYGRCVADGACQAADAGRQVSPGAPVTGVSYRDAQAYAVWYSGLTGQSWRLPTDAEWAFVAAERFAGDPVLGDDPDNPATAWLKRYREEAEKSRAMDATPKAAGAFGANSRGVFDLAGNVWEWTSTCYVRATLAPDRSIRHSIDNCGVRIAEGRHRTYMSNFIRDGKSGGCASGTPPENLGFRLVRDLGEVPVS